MESDEEDVEYELQKVYRVVDDKNLPFVSLAMRRLAMKNEGVKLFRITNAIFFLGDLIKIANPNIWFIDSKGKIFNYHKSTRAALKFYKVQRIIPINTGGAIVEVCGLAHRFKTLFMPENDKTHVGLLNIGMSKILYGFYTEAHKDTWRMV